MCGIAALYEPAAPAWFEETMRRMTTLVRHRGPDGEGLAFFRRQTDALESIRVASPETPAGVDTQPGAPAGCTLALGHRRLSILDLTTAGHQPMAAGDLWLTFNGEVYNYLEIRAELVACGHSFHTGTDTEVILAAYREWGEACLARFNGMFAFVLVDCRRAHVFAARDRFGVKPLYLWPTPTGGLALASEIKQFTVHPDWRARLNGQAAYDFLNWGLTDHTAATLFADVSQIRGGECLSCPLAELPHARPRRWYELKPAPFSGDLASASVRFRELLDDSVRLRLRADVAVGTCLSGGLDSSAIACTMRAQLGDASGARQNTFSAYSDVARFDERRFIEDVVQKTGATPHHLVPASSELLTELDDLVWQQDEPFGSTSIYAQWCVYRLARQAGVVVMLDGQGADEALGGYHGYFGPRLAGLLAQGRLLTFAKESVALRRLHAMPYGRQLRIVANELLPPALADRLRRIAGRTTQEPDFIDFKRLGASPRLPQFGSVNLRNPVRSLCVAQINSLCLPMLLHWADRDSMAHGIESRLPFLDYRLVEFCLGLPEEHKLSEGWTKRVLREGMRDRLPESVRLRRDKLGFATAEEVWMRTQQREAFIRLLDEAIAASQGILNAATRAKALRILDGKEPFSFFVWRVINFGRWLRRFEVQF